jgi:predicted esterase
MGCGAASHEGDKAAIVGNEVKEQTAPSLDGIWVPGADPIVFETAGEIDSCIIMAHGFLSDGFRMRSAMEQLLDSNLGVRCVLPTAPITYSDNVGVLKEAFEDKEDEEVGEMSVVLDSMARLASNFVESLTDEEAPTIHSWCDDVKFKSLADMLEGNSDEFIKSFESGHMKVAVDYFHKLIREQIQQGIKSDRIVVAGYGQGAFLAARAALSFPDSKLGGLVMVHGFLGGVKVKMEPIQEDLRVLLTHGGKDPIVTMRVAESSVTRLKELLPKGSVQFKDFEDMDHYVLSEIRDNQGSFGRLLLEYVPQA